MRGSAIILVLILVIAVVIAAVVFFVLPSMNRDGGSQNTGTIREIRLAIGGFHTCALKRDGTVWCWGYNRYGQLGDGTRMDRYTPVQVVNLTDVIQISAGALHTCALKRDGTVWCWGHNEYGQLGDGTKINRFSPVQVQNFTIN